MGRVVVSADGQGVVSHAGVGLLREMAAYTGLVDGITAALIGTYRGVPVHAPGRVFTDLAVAVADGADAISGITVLGDREDLFGPVASMPTTWRVLDRVDDAHLCGVREARAAARTAAWAAGAGPDLDAELCLDFDATITIAHSEKENAAATWKKRFGFHPLLCFLDRLDVAGGGALAGLLRGRERRFEYRRGPRHGGGDGVGGAARTCPSATWRGARAVARAEAVGPLGLGRRNARVRHRLCRAWGRVLLRIPIDHRIQRIVDAIPEQCWHPALQTDGEVRDGAWVAEATGTIDLTGWPEGSRLILRTERPHPGAQLTFTDVDGMPITALLTNTPPGIVPGQAAGLELRHRQHARVEDRIREAKATGLRNLPCRAWNENRAWFPGRHDRS